MTWAAGASYRKLYAPWFFSARRARAAGANSSPRSWTFLTMWTAHRAAWKNGQRGGGRSVIIFIYLLYMLLKKLGKEKEDAEVEPSSLCRSWRLGAAGRSPAPDLCTSLLIPYRPVCTEPETGHTGYCGKGHWRQENIKKWKIDEHTAALKKRNEIRD